MRLFFVLLLLQAISSVSFAQTITHLKGTVVGGKNISKLSPLSEGSKFEWGQTIASEDSSSLVRLKWDDSQLVLRGRFKIKLTKPSQQATEIQLLYGKLRAVFNKNKDDKKSFKVVTPAAVTGVRGTDFMTSFNDLLGETEVICFDGLLAFGNLKGDQQVTVKKGQWGGHGGRFRNEIGPRIDLPANILEHFSSDLPLE